MSERIEYTRRLERIENLKVKRNRLASLKQNFDSQISDNWGCTDEVVARILQIMFLITIEIIVGYCQM